MLRHGNPDARLFCTVDPSGRSENSRGAAMVEAAFVLPIILIIVFGMIDFGFVMTDSSSVNQGTRDAARSGIVAEVGSDTSCTITGASPSGDTEKLVCLAKDRIGLDDSDIRMKLIVGGSGDAGDALVVCTQFPGSSRTGFFFGFLLNDKVLKSRTNMRIEQAGSLASVEETAVDSGGSGGQIAQRKAGSLL